MAAPHPLRLLCHPPTKQPHIVVQKPYSSDNGYMTASSAYDIEVGVVHMNQTYFQYTSWLDNWFDSCSLSPVCWHSFSISSTPCGVAIMPSLQ